VKNFTDPIAVNTFQSHYLFGRLERKTLSADIRLNWTFTPALSLQAYFQPYISVGTYSSFHEFLEPLTSIYKYFDNTVLYEPNTTKYTIDPDGAGPSQPFSFNNPNFNFKSFRANVVLRWEVMPGSIFYFAWAHDQSNFDDPGNFNLTRDLSNLITTEGNDILLVKFSYWLNM